MTSKQFLKSLFTEPLKLFLIDGIGAILSAFLLGFVCVQLEFFFGIPPSTLYILALIPCIFAIYDGYCYFFVTKNYQLYLKAIAVANLLYCVLSLALAIYHQNSITYWGWLYIGIEIVIVLTLVYLEFKVANKLD